MPIPPHGSRGRMSVSSTAEVSDMQQHSSTTAKDVMRREVATLSADDSIETALALFEESRIGGAPVLANGRLVGMLTLTDISRPEHLREGRIETGREYDLSEPSGEERTDELDPDEVFYLKEDYSPEVLGRERVADWMSSGVVSVPADASLEEVCRVMVERQIHRVCVAEGSKLVGLITSFDVVRHVARGRREHRASRVEGRSTGSTSPPPER
jgi:CBS domain-containing protein